MLLNHNIWLFVYKRNVVLPETTYITQICKTLASYVFNMIAKLTRKKNTDLHYRKKSKLM